MRKVSAKVTQNYPSDIEELAASWGEAIEVGDHRRANRLNSMINRVAKRFTKDKNLGESVLLPLFQHHNPSVRMMAAVHALDLGFRIQEAEDILSSIAGDPGIRVIRLMAEINLAEWNKKKATKSVIKDEPAGKEPTCPS